MKVHNVHFHFSHVVMCSDVEREEERLLPFLPSYHLQYNYYRYLLFFL